MRGVVIGKFYPPHRGHRLLIETASAQCAQLHVIVCRRPEEQPPAKLRAAWLRELHPDAKVHLVEDTIDHEDSRGWAAATLACLGFRPDAAFTSEAYGERWAQCMGCRHVAVDMDRTRVPVSGSKVRTEPLSCWEYLDPPVRAWYAKRVVLVGAESTFKTTLAEKLAESFQTVWVPEFGRAFAERMLAEHHEYRWSSADFEIIARTQAEREDAAARRCHKVLICDTDAFATAIWHRRYMGTRSEAVERLAAARRRPDLYLLSAPDAPFVQDGTRDGEHLRQWMHETFIEEMNKHARQYEILEGGFEDRLRTAIRRIEASFMLGSSIRM